MPPCWTKLRPSRTLMKPKTYPLCTKHDWNAFIVLPCSDICFRQCKLRSRVGFCCRLIGSRKVGGRHPGGSGGGGQK